MARQSSIRGGRSHRTVPPNSSSSGLEHEQGDPITVLQLLQQNADITRLLLAVPGNSARDYAPKGSGIASLLRLTCKAMRDAVDRCAGELSVDSRDAPHLLASGALGRLPELTRLKCQYRGDGEESTLALLASLQSPERITAFNSKCSGFGPTRSSSLLFAVLPDRLPRLASLKWSYGRLIEGDLHSIGRLTGLQELFLLGVHHSSCCVGAGNDTSRSLAPLGGLRQLRKLVFIADDDPRHPQLSHADRGDEYHTPDWGSLLPHLRQLREAHLQPASLGTLLLLGVLPQLQVAKLTTHPAAASGCAMDEALLPAATFPHLASLYLDLHCPMTAAADGAKLAAAFARLAPRLQHLSLRLIDGGAGVPPALRCLTGLVSLTLALDPIPWRYSNFTALDNALLVDLSRRMVRLQALHLHLANSHRLSDLGFQAAAGRWGACLREVLLTEAAQLDDLQDSFSRQDMARAGENHITAATVLAFLVGCPDLRRIAVCGPYVDKWSVDSAKALAGRGATDGCLVETGEWHYGETPMWPQDDSMEVTDYW